MRSIKGKIVATLLAASLGISLLASTFVYRSLYSEARQSVVYLENSLQEARESLTVMERERDTVVKAIVDTQKETSRVDKVVVSVEKEIDKYTNSKRREAIVNEKVVVVEFEYIGDELNSLLTRGYNEIYLQGNSE